MPTLVHELHPMLVHAPLVLLPITAGVETGAATSSWPVCVALDRVARRLWWVTAGSALGAGLAGLAASREVRVEDDRAEDAMFVHGLGNFALLLSAFGVATWRTSHRASLTTAVLGLGAVGASLYTGWLGGNLVYVHGLGVKSSVAGPGDRTPLLSAEAPVRLAKDAVAGLSWLLGRAAQLATGKRGLHAPAITPTNPEATEPAASHPVM
jgi:uncharacterized membrane protein